MDQLSLEFTDPPLQEDEQTTLIAFLLYQQVVFIKKLKTDRGQLLPEEQLNQALPPSKLTLKSLIAHLWYVEDYWREEKILGQTRPQPWVSLDFAADPDAEFHWAKQQTSHTLVAGLLASCQKTRDLLAQLDLNAPIASTFEGEKINNRWVATHLLEEWARHLGHADFLREAIDGTVGD